MTVPGEPIRILLIAFDGVNLLDIGGPAQALEASDPRRGESEHYEVIVASAQGGEVKTSARIPIVTRKLDELDGLAIDTVIIGGGSIGGQPIVPAELVDWIRKNEPGLRRVCSICAGAFILAEAGLLEGRRATTHWRWAGALEEANPGIRVEADPIYIHDGKYWSSAGVTAGIDLTLALIQEDYGYRAAVEAARRLVVFMMRPGGQAQFSVPLLFQRQQDDSFAELHAWVRGNLTADLRVEHLAEHVGMSPRSFARSYAEAMGLTPAKAIEAMRAEAACGLLESSQLPLKLIADACGFGDTQTLRRVFLRRFGINPDEYRQRFAERPSPAGRN